MSIDEYKNYTNKILHMVLEASELNLEDFKEDHYIFRSLMSASLHFNMSTSTKFSVHYGLYCSSLKALGTDKHVPYLEKAYMMKDLGCFMMTEMAHGSNL